MFPASVQVAGHSEDDQLLVADRTPGRDWRRSQQAAHTPSPVNMSAKNS
jgi:hypothetical protein